MGSQLDLFFTTLFNEGEHTCFSKDIYGTKINDARYGGDDSQEFFSINPLKGTRKDENVLVHRNILIEFDKLPLEEQEKLGKTFPWTTCVFSGNKSYHFIISLETPCTNRKEYDALVRRIYTALPDCDKSTKNPSRFSRSPGVMRTSTCMRQTLHKVKRRITSAELEAWLGPAEPEKPRVIQPTKEVRLLNMFVQTFLRNGAEPGERNKELFKNACSMLRSGFTAEEIEEMVIPVLNLELREIRQCIASAAKKVRSE